MSWQLGALSILAVALAGGFAWYERTRPDARIVALVGTLAAFAALGRVAFAALPNVKPTTDIVLVAGYALGGGPGFAVGALGGLASNFFFGQGPWTPWQMAGWGVVGVIGAGLAVATRRRIGRWPLALVCAAVGFAFTMLQDVGDWVTYSDHSLASLGVYVGKGIGFDCIHAAGCLVFALAFGPALIRSLGRFATRLKVTWQPAAPPLAVILALAVALSLSVSFSGGVARSAGTPAGYLLAAQNVDGGFGEAPGSPSSPLYAGWVALGLAAAGDNPADVARGGHSLLGYIQTGVGSATDPGSVERTILVARAAGISARNFGGRDLVAALERDIRPNGSVSDQVNLTAFAVLALRAAGVAVRPTTLGWMVRQRDSDGGFNFGTRGGLSDVDDTGAVLEALAGARGAGPALARSRAIQYLRGQQDGDGGFPAMPGAGSNAQSTAFAVQGLVAAGVDAGSLRRRGASPLDYLRGLIAPDGHVRYARSADQTPVWVTAEALMALDAKPLPLAPVPRRAAPAAHAAVPHPTTPTRAATTTTTPAGRRRPAARRRHAAPAVPAVPTRPSPVATESDVNVERLAADVGILTALTLAPLGPD
jgi:energy-coupling factor transport system substrate-specific component